MAWMDNINTLTGLSVRESIRMTEDRDKWGKYVHRVANLGSRTAKEQNKTEQIFISSNNSPDEQHMHKDFTWNP